MLLLIVVLSAVLIFIVVNSLLTVAAKGGVIDARMQRYTEIKRDVVQSITDDQPKSQHIMQIIRFFGAKLKKVPQARDFDIKMQQAGLPLLGSEFFAVLLGTMLGSFVLMLILTNNIVTALGLVIMFTVMVLVYVNIKISQRQKDFNNQLGDALVMMANSMRSGFSFMQAVDMVANEMSAPISVEFAKLVGEMRLGIPTDDALRNISKRVGSKDFDLVIIAVIIHRQVGGNLAQILESISTTITERIKMKWEISSLTAQGRLSGWIVGLLPFALGLLLNVINPDYLAPLFTESIGMVLISVALVSQCIGIFFIMKIVNIDV